MTDEAVATTDPFKDVPSDPTDPTPAGEPEPLPTTAGPAPETIEPTTDESLGGFDLEQPPAEVETPVEESEESEAQPSDLDLAADHPPAPEPYDPSPAVGPEDVPEADGSVTPAEEPVAPPEPAPEVPVEPEPPAEKLTSNKRTYLCLEEVNVAVKGGSKKGWLQVTEVEARNGENAIRAAYRKLAEERGSYDPTRLVVVAERMFQPKVIKTRERRQAPAIEVG